MCSLCLAIPCHPRCPNASEPVEMYKCRICGEGIFVGDQYFDTGNSEICTQCMDEMTVDEILMLFDEKMKTA